MTRINHWWFGHPTYNSKTAGHEEDKIKEEQE